MRTCLAIIAVLFVSQTAWGDTAEVSVADSVRKYRFLAKTARDKKEYPEAIKYYRALLEYRADDLKIHYRVGELCYKTKNYAGAKQALNDVVGFDSLHVNSNILLYNLYMREDGHPDSAAVCLERLLEVKPGDVEKRRNLADLYRREGKVREAIAHYEQLVDVLAEADELIELLALLYEDLGETDRALEWRQRLMARGNGGVDLNKQLDALETMLRLQLETDDIGSAFESLQQLAQLDSANRYSYFSRIASLAEQHNNVDMRLKGWEGMVQANPRDLETIATLVEWYLNDGKVKRAEKWLDRGLGAQPDDAHLQLLKGDILVLQEDEEGALEAYEKAKADSRWETIAQQRIWQIRPPETTEEKLKREFFRKGEDGQEQEGN